MARVRSPVGLSFVGAFVARGLIFLCNLLQVRILLQGLGADGFGAFVTATTAAACVGILDLGIGNVLQNRVSRCVADGDRAGRDRAIGEAVAVVTASTGVILLVVGGLLGAAWLWGRPVGAYPLPLVWAVLIGVAFQVATLPFATIAKVANGAQELWLPQAWMAAAGVGFLALALLVPNQSFVAITVLWGTVNLATSIACAWQCWRRYALERWHLRAHLPGGLRMVRQGVSFLVPQVTALLIFNFPALFVSWHLPLASVAQLNVCQRLFSPLQMVMTLYLTSLWPAYTHAAATGNWDWVRKTYRLTLLWCGGGTLLAVLTVMVFADPLMRIWIGNRPEVWPSPWLLGLFGLWIVGNGIGHPAAYLLNALGAVKRQGIYGAISGAVTVAALYGGLVLAGPNILIVPVALLLAYGAITVPCYALEARRVIARKELNA